jgi:dihydrofolate synthase/folylpolyglutamate synthase
LKFDEAFAELDARQPERMIPDLDRITTLARVLGDPQLTYPTIHVTGTNGKTTTSRLVSALACAHGLTTGLYTSPHLESVTERIAICGEPISEADFAAEYGARVRHVRGRAGRPRRLRGGNGGQVGRHQRHRK